ncbi:MAG: hypothetical protein D6719_09255 [Candidatus Dadabacteria bacterium]|nr:MAG: hypothetical protein D6719_09255 [Candidatus Dadabacteria bacterium]
MQEVVDQRNPSGGAHHHRDVITSTYSKIMQSLVEELGYQQLSRENRPPTLGGEVLVVLAKDSQTDYEKADVVLKFNLNDRSDSVVTIAVRNADGENHKLANYIESVLDDHRIDLDKAKQNLPSEPGTVLYTLRPITR